MWIINMCIEFCESKCVLVTSYDFRFPYSNHISFSHSIKIVALICQNDFWQTPVRYIRSYYRIADFFVSSYRVEVDRLRERSHPYVKHESIKLSTGTLATSQLYTPHQNIKVCDDVTYLNMIITGCDLFMLLVPDKEEENAAQKLLANGNNTPITLSAIGG